MRHSLSNLLCSTAPTSDRPIGLFGRLASLSAGHLPEDSSSKTLSSSHLLHSNNLLPSSGYLSESRRAKSNSGLARLTTVPTAKQPSTKKKNILTLTSTGKTIIDTNLTNTFGAFNRHTSTNSSAGSATSSSGASSGLSHSDCLEQDEEEEEASVAGALVGDSNKIVSRLSHSTDLTVGVGKLKGAAALDEIFNYCHPRNTILVKLKRSVRGFGIALCGGWNCKEEDEDSQTDQPAGPPFSQLIRVKRLYPAQPATESGLIDEDDIILEANGTCFVGLTNIEAFNILHSIQDELHLKILKFKYCPTELQCSIRVREQPSLLNESTLTNFNLNSNSTSTNNNNSTSTNNNNSDQSIDSFESSSHLKNYNKKEADLESEWAAQFERLAQQSAELNESVNQIVDVELIKKDGSLGFTIAKIDFEGFFVKQITKAPAIDCPKIRPGDRIVQVNGVSLDGLSHVGAIQFLRSLPQTVQLRLSRNVNKKDATTLFGQQQMTELSTSTCNQSLLDCSTSDNETKRRTDQNFSIEEESEGDEDLDSIAPTTQPLPRKPPKLRHEVQIMLSERSSNDLYNRLKRKDRRRSKDHNRSIENLNPNDDSLTEKTQILSPIQTNNVVQQQPQSSVKSILKQVDPNSSVIQVEVHQESSFTHPECNESLIKLTKTIPNNDRVDQLSLQDMQQFFFRQSSVIDFKSTKNNGSLNSSNGSSSGTSNILRWRGMRLDELDTVDEQPLGLMVNNNGQRLLLPQNSEQDEQDSGFAEINAKPTIINNLASVSSKVSQNSQRSNNSTVLSKSTSVASSNVSNQKLIPDALSSAEGLRLDEIELQMHSEYEPPEGSIYRRITDAIFFYVMLDRGWHGRLGFSLADDMPHSPLVVNTLQYSFTACVVKELFPNSVAANCGRIQVGDKLLEVNFEPMINKPRKEVISELRLQKKLRILFLRKYKVED